MGTVILCLIVTWVVIGNVAAYRLYSYANEYCKNTYGVEYSLLIREMIRTKRVKRTAGENTNPPPRIATNIGFFMGTSLVGTVMGALLTYDDSRKEITLTNVDMAAKAASIKKLKESERT